MKQPISQRRWGSTQMGTHYAESLSGKVREFADFDAAFDFVIAENKRCEDHWSVRSTKPGAPKCPTEADLTEAAYRIAEGIFEALAPIDMSDFRAPAWARDSFDRQSAWDAEYWARRRAARMSLLSRSQARIAASDDITRHLQAAE